MTVSHQQTSADAFPRNQWYVSAWGDEIDQQLTARTILGRPVVLFCRSDGVVVALEDICPHRWMPLSMGTLVDDVIECGYHGFRFDGCGRCVAVPSQPEVPERARVRSYPLAEKGPLLWLWGGAPERADETLIPPTPELTDPSFRWVVVKVHIAGSYVLMHENVLDQTHFRHLHPGFAGTDEWDRGNISLEVADGKLIRTHFTPDAPAPPVARFAGIEPGTLVDSESVGTFVQPGLGTSTTTHRVRETGFAGVIQTFHIFTPETESSTRYCIAVGVTDPHGELGDFERGVLKATLEDQAAIEAVERNRSMFAPTLEVSVRSDQAGLQMRRLIRQRLAAEALGGPTDKENYPI
jgi:vanillate O-demethylase monooxygenase subunit